jgi:hypothetical protein
VPDVGELEPLVAELMASARREVVLIAPFIKEAVIRRLLEGVAPEVQLQVVTRWRLDEIVAGVSDLGVWPVVRDHGGRLLLLGNLHAKVYLADGAALVGSANLTSAALVGPDRGNLETLISTDRSHPTVVGIEAYIKARSTEATEDLHLALSEAAAEATPQSVTDYYWVPTFRHPTDLLAAAEGTRGFTKDQTRLARQELASLGLRAHARPNVGLISAALTQQPVIQALGHFVSVPGGRRFGEVRRWSTNLPTPNADPQTLIRWVLEYLPNDFEYTRPHHTEVISRRTRGH